MAAPQVAISQDFFLAFAQIPRGKQKKVNEFVSKFRTNPQSSGINYEKINDAANAQYRSVRIDQEYRGIVYKPEKGNVFLMLWVDKHDDAYDWARRHKCQVNPETGSLQLFQVEHSGTVPANEQEVEPAAVEAEPLFQLRDREFLRLGVPEENLDAVKAITTVEQLKAMKPQLPVEVFEALLFLSEGLPLDEVLEEYAVPDGPPVDVDDIETALDRSQSRRRFFVVEDERELQAMLSAPLEQWRVFLHPSQRKLVERDWNGPIRVLGGAGTGKTVVAMHRARWLVRNVLQEGERILFTTFTRNLAMDIEANLRKICSSDEMKRIEVTNVDAWVHRFLKRENLPTSIVYPGQEAYSKAWDKALSLADSGLGFSDSFYQEEWERVVLPQRIHSKQDYFRAKRIGRGVALTRKQRAAIWQVFEEMRLQLQQKGLMTVEDAVHVVLDMLQEGAVARPYRCAIVDEAQDFGMESLRLVRSLVPEDKNDLFIVGDGHQRIYGRKAALGHAGINIRGRGRKLKINYRTTEQIRKLATAVLEDVEVDDMDDSVDTSLGYRSLIEGNKPILKGFDFAQQEAEWVVKEIETLLANGQASQSICVVGRTIRETAEVEKEMARQGLESRQISRDSADNSSLTGIRLANIHRVKGLEFQVVFIVGAKKGRLPLDLSLNATEDPVELKARDLNERALFHVAATRAVHSLYITWNGDPSPYLPGD